MSEREYIWKSLEIEKPKRSGLYAISYPIDSPSPYSNDKINGYSIAFWSADAFWNESDRLKGITHWFELQIPYNPQSLLAPSTTATQRKI